MLCHPRFQSKVLIIINDNLKSLVVDRQVHPEWVKVSSEKLFMLIERLLDALISHDNVNVHLALVCFCSQIADRCYFTLNEHLGVLLRALVTFAASSESDKLRNSSIEGLKVFENKGLDSRYEAFFSC